jgi:hypothetical protein
VRGAASIFVMCTRGLTDPAYPKYPRLPVRNCAGFEPGTPPDPAAGTGARGSAADGGAGVS